MKKMLNTQGDAAQDVRPEARSSVIPRKGAVVVNAAHLLRRSTRTAAGQTVGDNHNDMHHDMLGKDPPGGTMR